MHRTGSPRSALDWKAERATFISDKTSQRTRAVYERALGLLNASMETHKLTPPASLKIPREANDFIRELRRRPTRCRHRAYGGSVASSFFTFLERRDATIRNPFRGLRSAHAPLGPWPPSPPRRSWRFSSPRPTPCSPRPWPWWRRRLPARGDLPCPLHSRGRPLLDGLEGRQGGVQSSLKEAKRMIHLARLDPQQPFSLQTFDGSGGNGRGTLRRPRHLGSGTAGHPATAAVPTACGARENPGGLQLSRPAPCLRRGERR